MAAVPGPADAVMRVLPSGAQAVRDTVGGLHREWVPGGRRSRNALPTIDRTWVFRAGGYRGKEESVKILGFGRSSGGGSPDPPVLITEAAPSLYDQQRARIRKYVILMSCRIPALVLAAVTYGMFHNPWISATIIGVSVPLPWIAVLIANDRPPRSKREPSRWDVHRADLAALEEHERDIEDE